MKGNLMERRDLLKGFLYLIGANCSACAFQASAQIWPGQSTAADRESPFKASTTGSENEVEYAGCQGLDIYSFSGGNDTFAQGLTNTSGELRLDQTLQQEKRYLDRAFLVSPSFAYLTGPKSGGAFATSKNYINPQASGTVMLGLDLMKADWQGTGSAIAGIMGHEWAHICQFTYLGSAIRNSRVYQRELQADFLAAWYLVNRGLDSGNVFDLMEFRNSLYAKGDFDFHNPDHHGTPMQRWDALLRGAQFGLTGVNSSTTIAQAFSVSRQIYNV